MIPSHARAPRTVGARADVPPLPPVAAGHGHLEIVRQGAESVVTRAFATSPLRLLTPANHGHAAWIYTSSYGGGLVDGDRLEIDVSVGAEACAYFATQASTKVYRSPQGTAAVLRGRIDRDALLIVAPDPVVCFAGARYRQTQRFDLDERGALVLLDCFTSGRWASGERWAFAEYRSLAEVWIGGRLILHDATALRARDGSLEERLGRFNVVATVVLAGETLATEAARLIADSLSQPVVRRGDVLMTASPLGGDGCLVRVAATTLEHAWRSIRRALRFIPDRLGDDPWSRKW